jgi:hypothetical protein
MTGDEAAESRIPGLLAALPRPAGTEPDGYDRPAVVVPTALADLTDADQARLDELLARIHPDRDAPVDSLTAVVLAAAVHEAFGLRVPLALLLDRGIAALGR